VIDGGCTAYPSLVPERTALYRRYRPQTFGAIIGQEHVTRTLKNAIAASQVAHAYLLAGTRGTGKTSIARLIAKAVNCPKAKDGEPCDRCENCVAIREGRFLDLIEIDAASNRGIDEMRDLREKVRFAPSLGQYKVYVIDEAHQLTNEAFNALLKTLEEPPPHVIFVLATTESQRIPATIVSRTQRFDLRRISHKGIVQQLGAIVASEGLTAEPAALEAVARHAQGSLRDAESILDQLAAFSDGTIGMRDVEALLGLSDWEETVAFFAALAANDGAKGVMLVGTLVDEGRDLRLFVRRAIEHLRALVLVRASGTVPDSVSESVGAALREQAPRFPLERLARIAKRLVEAEQYLRSGEGTPLPLELAVLELTSVAETPAPQTATRSTQPPAPAPRTPPGPSRGASAHRPVDLAERRERSTRVESAPASSAAAPAVSFERVRIAWSELVERTKEESVGKAAQLVKAEPIAIEGTTVVIGFNDEFARSLWADKRRPELEHGLSAVLGATVRVKCVKQQNAPPPASDDPMMRAALETLVRPERILEVE